MSDDGRRPTKERIRAALDILQNYVGEDGKIDATKLTTRITALEAENRSLVAERDRLHALHLERTQLTERVIAERDALRAERDRLQDRCNTYVVNMAEQGNEIERIRAERDALREMLLAAQYDIDTIDPEMAQKLCDFYAAPPEEGRLDCGDDCEMCSGEYCTKHPHEACDCDVIDRHRPEEG